MTVTSQLTASPSTAGSPDQIPRNPLKALFSPYTWLATTHLLSGLFVSIPAFVIGTLFLTLPWPLLPLVIPGVVAFLILAPLVRVVGVIERARFRMTLGVQILPPELPRWEGRPIVYFRTMASSSGLWRLVAYCLLGLPVTILTFTLTLVVWSGPIALIALPAMLHLYPHHRATFFFFHITTLPWTFLPSGVGLFLLLFITTRVVEALAVVEAAFGRALLGRSVTEELRERVGELETTRRRVVDSAEDERRRIERDLHDGAQQRLVALAMALGRAKAKLPAAQGDADAEAVRALIDEAHGEAKLAIVELRDLTRGLHPPVLTDRGLDAALSALAARSPVPTQVNVDLPDRPPPTLEAIAYFVVAEALTNVAKHAQATRIAVSVRRLSDAVRVTVTDDGVGGADPRHGSGITGLADRVAGVDGRLTVDSPPGGPTVLCADLPWRTS
jgi:signal transduction histidine kinase